MSDSGSSSINGETRMLERRVSNNRADLTGDQKVNYFLSWFNGWSDLQKSDFVAVLVEKTTNSSQMNGHANNIEDKMASMALKNGIGSNRPPSLFACQVKLFKEWFDGWSDDQKEYLNLRIQDIDPAFYQDYEEYLSDPEAGKTNKEKDYFEPGVPSEYKPSRIVEECEEDLIADEKKSNKEKSEENQEENSEEKNLKQKICSDASEDEEKQSI